jgi:G3E family GTPase
VRRQARDRYVGGEVRRQLVGADLLVVTKLDVCTEEQAAAVASWLDGEAPGVPRVDAIDGDIPVDLVLGIRPDAAAGTPHAHHVAYESWSWVGGAVGDSTLERLRSDVPAGVLRLKGIVERPDGSHLAIQIVGRTPDSWCQAPAVRGSRVVAIGVRGRLDTAALDALFGA